MDQLRVEYLAGYGLEVPDVTLAEAFYTAFGLQADTAAADREGRERVGSVEAAEPTQVGVLGRSRHHQDVTDGGSGGTSHGRRMTEVGSP